MKTFLDFHIRPILKKDFSRIIQIVDNCFGRDYLAIGELALYLNNEDKIGVVAYLNNEIAGFALAHICDLKTLLHDHILCEKNWFKTQFSGAGKVGLFKMIAVDPIYSKKGVGYALTEYRAKQILKETNYFLAILWSQKKNPANIRIIEKLGFKRMLKIENYWKTDSIIKRYDCAVCGHPPCTCNAIVYEMRNDLA